MDKHCVKDIEELNQRFEKAEPEEVLKYFMKQYGDRIALSSSLSIEDHTLADMMLKISPKARVFTLDTGRLFPETYQLIDKTNLHYNIKMEISCPLTKVLHDFVRKQGVNPFYDSIEQRHVCCQVRKLEPLS